MVLSFMGIDWLKSSNLGEEVKYMVLNKLPTTELSEQEINESMMIANALVEWIRNE